MRTSEPGSPMLTEQQVHQIFEDGGIFVEGRRASRAKDAIYAIEQAVGSLVASARLFPGEPPAVGEIDPQIAVESFCRLITDRLDILSGVACNEDDISHPFDVAAG